MESTGRFTPTLRRITHYGYDHCSNCGQTLPRGVPALAGYKVDGTEVYVGQCCASLVHELASYIYWWWTTFQRPNPETPIWRYMDIARLLSMLNSNSLFFPRADTLGDPFEGARGLASRQQEWCDFYLNFFRQAVLSPPEGSIPPTPEKAEQEAQRLYASFMQSGEQELKNTYVSCWHANDVESEAQWRLYTPPGHAGIALRTTFGRLDAALDQDYDVRAGFVNYVDFKHAFAGLHDRVFWKRASLRHEAELRAVISFLPSNIETLPGIDVPLRICDAIEAVVISPFAPEWVEHTVRATLHRYGQPLRVERSTLLEQPFF